MKLKLWRNAQIIFFSLCLLAALFIFRDFIFQTLSPGLKAGMDLGFCPRHKEPEFLTFNELKQLSKDPKGNWGLQWKLERFWRTPIIDNGAYYRGVKPHSPKDPALGPYLRVASWNIEKSILVPQVMQFLTSDKSFLEMVNPAKAPPDSEALKNISRQRERLLNADILILQEMDIGHKRSGYLNAAAELAKALDMNYAYGAEQLEIDPAYLGTEKILRDNGEVDQEAIDYYAGDPKKYKGVFGSAVLSRYPIKRVEVFQLKNQAYDWYTGEKPQTTFLEKSRRFGAQTVFKNEVTREMKVGGRIFFRVDLDVPEVPGGTLTVIDIHLEIKCQPEGRQRQIQEILGYIQKIKNPVIVSGDFNSAPSDLSPTSVTRTAKRIAEDPTTWFSAAVTYLSPYALAVNTSRFVGNFTKDFQDPTASDIPVVLPNKVKGLFESVEIFRFSDGASFDFRGDVGRSINGKKKTLANSNQRDFKGFKTTFSVKRPIGPIGKYRLDWMFIKSNYLKTPLQAGSYRFAPHFGETLEEMNTSLKQPLSDHHPNVVDLPFNEPAIGGRN